MPYMHAMKTIQCVCYKIKPNPILYLAHPELSADSHLLKHFLFDEVTWLSSAGSVFVTIAAVKMFIPLLLLCLMSTVPLSLCSYSFMSACGTLLALTHLSCTSDIPSISTYIMRVEMKGDNALG